MQSINKPILSICIPTDGNVKWVMNTLQSIYNQDCNLKLFEVIITDNGKTSDLEQAIDVQNFPKNLFYYKTTEQGFYNLTTALKKGNGLYCKMLNHRSILYPGVIQKMIDIINKYQEDKPTIYFTDGVLGKFRFKECPNFEIFVQNMSYWSSWSAGIGIWDTDKVALETIKYNKMFPNTSILFEIRQNGRYIIWNEKYQEMQDETGKGGYNIYKTFAVDYLDIINDLRLKNRISIKTFIQIKANLYTFIKHWYDTLTFNKNKYTFETSDMELYLNVYYSKTEINNIKNKYRQIKRILISRLNQIKPHSSKKN